MPGPDPTGARFIEEAFWIVLGRAPSQVEVDDELRGFQGGEPRTLLRGLLSSSEFRRTHAAWKGGRSPRDLQSLEATLGSLGTDERFIERAYQCLFGRPADEAGLRHYVGVLASGAPRTNVIRALVSSEEFDRRWSSVPRDTQLCELANPAKWDNEEWLDILRSLGLSDDKLAMHRKPYEFTQLIYGCRRLGALRDDSTIVSVGAGHELVLYWLANHVRRIVATDMYEGVWQGAQGREGDPGVIQRPEEYAPFSYRRDRLVFMKMDGRRLAFRSDTFDVAYSLSSIEHFGGLSGAAATIREMGRILKPGGILALATEYVLHGPRHEETFQADEFMTLVAQPGLELVAPFDRDVYRRYEYAAIDLYKTPYQTPHMVVRFNDTVFTTAMVFLRKVIA